MDYWTIFLLDTMVTEYPFMILTSKEDAYCALNQTGLGVALRETGKNLLLIPEDKDRMLISAYGGLQQEGSIERRSSLPHSPHVLVKGA
jgi:hypothetical protein